MTPFGGLSTGQLRLVRLGLGALGGAVLGLGYYALVGCTTGCFASNPLLAASYGALAGTVVAFR